MATTKKAAATTDTVVSHAKPKTAAKKKPTAKEQAAASVAKMRQANLAIAQPAAVAEIMQIPVNFIHCAAQVRTDLDCPSEPPIVAQSLDGGGIRPALRACKVTRQVAGLRHILACGCGNARPGPVGPPVTPPCSMPKPRPRPAGRPLRND